jgi:hypothetical protein
MDDHPADVASCVSICRQVPANTSIIKVYDGIVPKIRTNAPESLIFSSPDVITGL